MFRKLFDFLARTLGGAFAVFLWFLRFFLVFLPLHVLDLGFLPSLGIVALILLTGSFGNLVYGCVWIWAFTHALQMPADPLIIVFYIVFGLHVLNLVQAVVRAIFFR